MKPKIIKSVLVLVAVLVLAGAVYFYLQWQDQREIAFIKSLASRHPEGQTYVNEILKARAELKDKDKQNDFSAILRLGVNYNNLGEKQKALQYYQEALKIEPQNLLALNNTGEIYSDLGQYQKAEEYFLKLTEYYPDKPDFWRKLGYLYRFRLNKTPAEIEAFFKTGLAKTNNNPNLINWLIAYFQEIGDSRKMVEYLNLLGGKK